MHYLPLPSPNSPSRSDADELIATVSHDMRVPLAAIKGYAETLRRGAPADRLRRTRFLRVIERHADQLNQLVEDLLTLSALDRGQPCGNALISVKDSVLSAVKSLRAQAKRRRVRFRTRVSSQLRVVIERERLTQVLENLLTNAIKYNRYGGLVDVSAAADGAMVRVNVRDTGIGISAKELPAIFTRFHRTAAARLQCHGTGLGLSIVKRIIRCHGGRTRVASVPGRGSTFSFTLPGSPLACRRNNWERCRRDGRAPSCPFSGRPKVEAPPPSMGSHISSSRGRSSSRQASKSQHGGRSSGDGSTTNSRFRHQ